MYDVPVYIELSHNHKQTRAHVGFLSEATVRISHMSLYLFYLFISMIQARFGIVGIESLECVCYGLFCAVPVCGDIPTHTPHSLSVAAAVVSSGLLPRDPLSTSKIVATSPAILRGSKFVNE